MRFITKSRCIRISLINYLFIVKFTCRPHVNEGVVDEHKLVKVELVSEPFAFSLVQDPFIVVISGGTKKLLTENVKF